MSYDGKGQEIWKVPEFMKGDKAAKVSFSPGFTGSVPKQRKKVHIPTDENGKPDYENIRTTAKEAREISDGKVIKAFISW